MTNNKKPCAENDYLSEYAKLMIWSYSHWTGKALVKQEQTGEDLYRALFYASYALVAHNTEVDPIFNYGNQTALDVFEMDWSEFTRLASRKSAETVNRPEREKLIARVSKHGFIDDYRGIRISSTGRRFMIEDATVWNIIDEKGVYYGQAAVFYKWLQL